ncbi:hypothetical protein V1512DRAFT_275270 [Lipomyces arxii]|uniref:uncharacterized protein n=1 Tax=Lipomyces arxii TaxID=56418 RepID=UPI0034CE59C7
MAAQIFVDASGKALKFYLASGLTVDDKERLGSLIFKHGGFCVSAPRQNVRIISDKRVSDPLLDATDEFQKYHYSYIDDSVNESRLQDMSEYYFENDDDEEYEEDGNDQQSVIHLNIDTQVLEKAVEDSQYLEERSVTPENVDQTLAAASRDRDQMLAQVSPDLEPTVAPEPNANDLSETQSHMFASPAATSETWPDSSQESVHISHESVLQQSVAPDPDQTLVSGSTSPDPDQTRIPASRSPESERLFSHVSASPDTEYEMFKRELPESSARESPNAGQAMKIAQAAPQIQDSPMPSSVENYELETESSIDKTKFDLATESLQHKRESSPATSARKVNLLKRKRSSPKSVTVQSSVKGTPIRSLTLPKLLFEDGSSLSTELDKSDVQHNAEEASSQSDDRKETYFESIRSTPPLALEDFEKMDILSHLEPPKKTVHDQKALVGLIRRWEGNYGLKQEELLMILHQTSFNLALAADILEHDLVDTENFEVPNDIPGTFTAMDDIGLMSDEREVMDQLVAKHGKN